MTVGQLNLLDRFLVRQLSWDCLQQSFVCLVMRRTGMEKSQLRFMYGMSVLLSLQMLWITRVSARSEYRASKEQESVMELPILTSLTNTESIPFVNTASSEVTSESATSDVYDQISPSRDPTTPISRNYLKLHQDTLANPSTIPTILNAPPPFYYGS